jgi:hypothetical protein
MRAAFHGEGARHVGGDDRPGRRVRRTGRLAEQPRHEAHLEHAEAEGAARLAGEPLDNLVTPALEDVGRLQEDRLAGRGRRLRPFGERRRRGLDGAAGVVAGSGRDVGDDVARERVGVVEPAPVAGLDPLAADEVQAVADARLGRAHRRPSRLVVCRGRS